MKIETFLLHAILAMLVLLFAAQMAVMFTAPKKVMYEGHSYIKYGCFAVVHDPECPKCYYVYD